eukprot:TRINITY_DN7830_c1_g1_i1.p1 TRINITY_DN7830_c1_g1~~TRINITY_DN7830_c1_g1_i1.p1  ORF type:complete len:106 (-),score=4.37 TRINITY_DN7830_c1_g1_i1:470-787(-)
MKKDPLFFFFFFSLPTPLGIGAFLMTGCRESDGAHQLKMTNQTQYVSAVTPRCKTLEDDFFFFFFFFDFLCRCTEASEFFSGVVGGGVIDPSRFPGVGKPKPPTI